MFPVYRCMDPYPQTFPHQREPNSYPCYYYPSWEAIPPQMKVDSFKHPSTFGPLPFNGNIGHPNPTDHNNCCNHSYPTGYYSLRPPCSHVLPPPQPYYYGPYSPYPDSYGGYFIPPAHYSVDQARYDYDKARNHCCGCPNHACHWKDDSTLKIEEQNPEKEQGSDSSSLIQLPNYPYPVMWIPSSYMKNKDTDKISDSQPGHQNGWIPLDVNSLNGLRQGGEEKKSCQSENKRSQLPFPVIWMPGYDKPDAVKELKEINIAPKAAEEWPSNFKIIPLKLLENENRGEKPGAGEDEPRYQVHPEAVVEKESRTQSIPVKQLEDRNEKLEKTEEKVEEKKSISEKQKEESGVKKASDKKESSPVKSSKLPPVCLRVDPLPRRKTTNGTSRSPSPPGLKEKKRAQQDSEEQGPMKETEEEIPKKVPVIGMKDKLSNQAEKKEQKCQNAMPVGSLKDTSGKAASVEAGKSEEAKEGESKVVEVLENTKAEERKDYEEGKSAKVEHKMEENKGDGETLESEKMEEKKEGRRDLSQSDAAVVIQSAFRGFEVRRWQPLEKLRKIARIREQVGDVKRQILSLEASPREDTKQRVVIGETIMNLLLQLDTIQGLHSSVREVRKCVVRELICLQEKLDTLGSQVTQEHKLVKVEENLTEKVPDDEASYMVSSCPDAKHTSEQESLQQKTDSVGITPTKEPANTEENVGGRSNDEVAFLVSQSLITEPDAEQETVKPAGDNGAAEQSSLESKETLSDQKEDAESAREGEEPKYILASDELLPLLRDAAVSSGDEEHKEVPPLKEYRHDSEVEVPMEFFREPPCNPEVSADLQLPAADTVPELNFLTADFGSGEKANPELEKPSVPSLEEGSKLEEAALIKTEEPELTPDAGESVVLPPGGEKLDSGIMASKEQNEEARTEQEKLQFLPLVEEGSGYMENAAGIADADNTSSSEASLSEPTCMEEGNSVERIIEENPAMSASVNAGGEMIEGITDVSQVSKEESGIMVRDESLIPEPTNETDNPAPEEEGSTHSHLVEQASVTSLAPTLDMCKEEKKLVKENEKLREMMERLLEAGKEQLGVISELNARVKDLERRIAQKKRAKVKRARPTRLSACKVSC